MCELNESVRKRFQLTSAGEAEEGEPQHGEPAADKGAQKCGHLGASFV